MTANFDASLSDPNNDENQLVIMAGIGEHSSSFHLVAASSPSFIGGFRAAQRVMGDNYRPITAFTRTDLLAFAAALADCELRAGEAKNMTDDPALHPLPAAGPAIVKP